MNALSILPDSYLDKMNEINDLNSKWKKLNIEIKRLENEKRKIRMEIKRRDYSLPKPESKNRKQKRERNLRFVELYKSGKTLEQIGIEHNLTRERVRQIVSNYDVVSSDGGIRKKMKEIRSKSCKDSDCKKLAIGPHGYCGFHYGRIKNYGTTKPEFKRKFWEHESGCLVEGCKEYFKSNGLCNKHVTGYRYNMKNGNVKDLNDYLEVQKAKEMMGKSYALFSEIREFMKSNRKEPKP